MPRSPNSLDRRRLAASSCSIRIAVALNSAVPDFGVGGVDGQQVGRDVVLEVQRHERQARAAATSSIRIGHLDLAAPRDDAHELALGEPEAPASSGEMSSDLAAAQRRRVAAGLDAGVVRVEPAAGGQADREVVVELVDRRVVLDRDERRRGARAPGPPTGGSAGTARPGASRRSTATGGRPAPRAARSSCRRGPARAARTSFQTSSAIGLAPVGAHPAGELEDDPQVVARLAAAARAPCARAGRAARSW